MNFTGELVVRAPASFAWDLLVHPTNTPRYAEQIRAVEADAAEVRVGSRQYTYITTQGRRVPCTEFVSESRPHRTFCAEAKIGMLQLRYRYDLERITPPGDYREGTEEQTRLRWSVDVELQSAAHWLVMPFVLFLPVLVPRFTFQKRYDAMMKQLAAVARADYEATA